VKELEQREKEKLKLRFKKLEFSALNFTDSRNVYQFYPLSRLWSDIQILLESGITLWHPATEPVSAGELYRYMTGEEFVNELNNPLMDYDYKTVHYEMFEGKNGYICSKENLLEEIKKFCNR